MASDGNSRQNEPRQPKDIKGLLKFCMEATKREDASGASNFEPMSEERKKWLEEALTAMSVSPTERMSLCIQAIMDAEPDTEEGTEQQVRALTELQDWAEDIDIARDFIKIKGLAILPRLLPSEVSELRWRCLELLGILSQNNPFVQHTLLSLKIMPALLALIDQDPNPTVRVKALYAVSCLVRSHSEAQVEFVSNDGLPVLLRAVASGEDKLIVKATFFMSFLCEDNPGLRDTLTGNGAVQLLVKILKETEHCSSHEHLMSALLNIVTENAAAKQICNDPALDLKSFLNSRIKQLAGKEEYEEEKEYADKILQILNRTSGMTSSHSQESPKNMAVMAIK